MNTVCSRQLGARLAVMAALTVLALATVAVADDATKTPGYYDLSWIEIPGDAAEIQDIDLTTMLSQLEKDAEKDGDAELAQVLRMVTSLRVKAFSLTGEDKRTEKAVQKITEDLPRKGWNRLMFLKDEGETVTVSSMHKDGLMVGLMVVVYEPGEQAAFVNVVGDLDLATLLGLAGEFDFDDLDEIAEEYGGGEAETVRVE